MGGKSRAIFIDVGTLVEMEEGTTAFSRKRVMNIAEGRLIRWTAPGKPGGKKEEADYLYKELDVYLGRQLGLCNRVTSGALGDAEHHEDPHRKGYVSKDAYDKLAKWWQNDEDVPKELREHFGANEDFLFHDTSNPHTFPTYMGRGGRSPDKTNKFYPLPDENGTYDHVADFVYTAMKHYFNDFTWPRYYEPINEPNHLQMSQDDFSDFYVGLANGLRKLGLPREKMLIGGPCLWGCTFFMDMFTRPFWMHMKKFYHRAVPSLDFYSFHVYETAKEDEGALVATCSRTLDAIFDLNENVVLNACNGVFKPFVTSEFGAGAGVASTKDMDVRRRYLYVHMYSCCKMMLTMAYRPYSILKAVPYLASECDWSPEHFCGLYIRENFDKKKPFQRSELFLYLEFWRDFRGRFVDLVDDGLYPDIVILPLLEDNCMLRVAIVNLSTHNTQTVAFRLPHRVNAHSRKLRRLFADEATGYAKVTEEDVDLSAGPLRCDITVPPRDVQLHTFHLKKGSLQAIEKKTVRYNRFYGKETEVVVGGGDGSAQIHIDVPRASIDHATRAELRISFARPGTEEPTPVSISINQTDLPWVPGEDLDPKRMGDTHVRFRKYTLDVGMLQESNAVQIKFPSEGGLLLSAILTTFEPI